MYLLTPWGRGDVVTACTYRIIGTMKDMVTACTYSTNEAEEDMVTA